MPRLLLLVLLSSSLVPSCHSLSATTIPSLLLISSFPLPSLPARLSPRSSLCGGSLDLQTYLFMNQVDGILTSERMASKLTSNIKQVCEDCFSLFRDTDVYTACRSCKYISIINWPEPPYYCLYWLDQSRGNNARAANFPQDAFVCSRSGRNIKILTVLFKDFYISIVVQILIPLGPNFVSHKLKRRYITIYNVFFTLMCWISLSQIFGSCSDYHGS